MNTIGFGDEQYTLAIYLANRPELDDYRMLNRIKPLTQGELQWIVSQTSNHWRKVFNVYAKFITRLRSVQGVPVTRWQDYRDSRLLQSGSGEALLFTAPDLERADTLHIVAGKAYAAQLPLPPLQWLDPHFAVNRQHRLIVAPYLDYRQLSDRRIERLVVELNRLGGAADA